MNGSFSTRMSINTMTFQGGRDHGRSGTCLRDSRQRMNQRAQLPNKFSGQPAARGRICPAGFPFYGVICVLSSTGLNLLNYHLTYSKVKSNINYLV